MPSASTARFASALARDPAVLVRRGRELASDLTRIAAGSSNIGPASRDRGFTDAGWKENPLLRRLLQAYLATSSAALDVVDRAVLAEIDRVRVRAGGERGSGPAIGPTTS